MDWVPPFLGAAFGTGFGFVAGRLGARMDRHAAAKEADKAREADWELPWRTGSYWTLRNCGNAAARDVEAELQGGTGFRTDKKHWDLIDVGAGEPIGIVSGVLGAKLVITWTSRDGTRKTATRVPGPKR